ncbi:MAG TPA: hypothetical protein HPP83_05120 [Candidatus Hydrogenedentes bacterium]|nr:hypothetical protein [Candidatus Hydrogenedentota bacterium]
MMLTQKKWRWCGGITVGCCAVMAVVGAHWEVLRKSLVLLLIYWSVFLVLFIVTVLIVLLDIKYIRMHYALGKREVFRRTLGDEKFRKELREAQRKHADKTRLN